MGRMPKAVFVTITEGPRPSRSRPDDALTSLPKTSTQASRPAQPRCGVRRHAPKEPSMTTASPPDAPSPVEIIMHAARQASCEYGSHCIQITHRDPAFALTRRLMALGVDPATPVQTRWANSATVSLRGRVGVWATLATHEDDNRGRVRFVRYRPKPESLMAAPGTFGSDLPADAPRSVRGETAQTL